MIASVLLVASLLTTYDVTPKAPAATRPAPTAALLDGINAGDGIDYMEAFQIAQVYFAVNVGCGGFSGIRDGGGVWIVDGQFGFAGTPILGFSIDKLTGAISSPIGPSYARPADMAASGD